MEVAYGSVTRKMVQKRRISSSGQKPRRAGMEVEEVLMGPSGARGVVTLRTSFRRRATFEGSLTTVVCRLNKICAKQLWTDGIHLPGLTRLKVKIMMFSSGCTKTGGQSSFSVPFLLQRMGRTAFLYEFIQDKS